MISMRPPAFFYGLAKPGNDDGGADPMPELPEVETVARGLALRLAGRRIARAQTFRHDLRRPFPDGLAGALTGRRVESVGRRAKYILVRLDDGLVWLVHLGMSGRMVLTPEGEAPPRAKHDHLELVTDDGWLLRYNDARRFGLMDLVPADALDDHPLLKGIGPEPLGNEFNGPALAAGLAGRKPAVKPLLLDQRLVAGVGNIYASEALYQAQIHPETPAGRLTPEQCEALAAAIKDVLTRAVAAGGSSIRDYVQSDGELGYFQHEWAVYERGGQPCKRCSAPIARIVQAARASYFCPHCQPTR